MKHGQLNNLAFAWVFAIFGAVGTFVIGVLGQLGMYMEGVVANQFLEVMNISNPFYIFDLSTWYGTLLGTVEAFVFWFLMGYVFALLYNKFI
ncbi:MAG: hypothetical protein ABIJ18_02120 [archaeon]